MQPKLEEFLFGTTSAFFIVASDQPEVDVLREC